MNERIVIKFSVIVSVNSFDNTATTTMNRELKKSADKYRVDVAVLSKRRVARGEGGHR